MDSLSYRASLNLAWATSLLKKKKEEEEALVLNCSATLLLLEALPSLTVRQERINETIF